MGSDGLWEFMGKKRVAKIIENYESKFSTLSYILYKNAFKAWKKKE